jgi:hypothetical protein
MTYSKAEEEFIRGKISHLMSMGYGVDKISSALQVPRATVSLRMRSLRREAMKNSERFMESLPLEIEFALDNLGSLYGLGYSMFHDDNLRMSPNSKVNLLNVLKDVVNSRIALLSNVSIIKDIQSFTTNQRNKLELMKKQATPIVHQEERSIDEMMKSEGMMMGETHELPLPETNQHQQQLSQQIEGIIETEENGDSDDDDNSNEEEQQQQ